MTCKFMSLVFISWLGIGSISLAQTTPAVVSYPATWTADQKEFMNAVLEELGRLDAGKPAGHPQAKLRDRVITDINKGVIIFKQTTKGDVETAKNYWFFGDLHISIPPTKLDAWSSAKALALKCSALDPNNPTRIRAEEDFRRLNIDWGFTFAHEYVHRDKFWPSGKASQEVEAWGRRIAEEKRMVDDAYTALQNEMTRVKSKGGTLSETDRQALLAAQTRLKDLMAVHQQTVSNDLNVAVTEKVFAASCFPNEASELAIRKGKVEASDKELESILNPVPPKTNTVVPSTSSPGTTKPVATATPDPSTLLPGTTVPDPGNQGSGPGTGATGHQKPVSLQPVKIYKP